MKALSANDLPAELLGAICAHVYSAGLPTSPPSLDPLVCGEHGIPSSLPSALPPGSWSEPTARHTLASLCLVNHAFSAAARPWLWRQVQIRLPHSWLALLDQISDEAGAELGDAQAALVDHSIAQAAGDVLAAKLKAGMDVGKDAASKLRLALLETLSEPNASIPPELLSPLPSRDPSPRRIRGKSPPRWKIMRSISHAMERMIGRDDPGFYVPTPSDPKPGRYVRHLDFNHFRTVGMRRLVDEGINNRFVTGARLEAALKEMPSLSAFGATEYMDGALTLSVLKELFLRGSPSRMRGRSSRGRPGLVDSDDDDEGDQERLGECADLEAVDLTGCISAVFVNALSTFVSTFVQLPVEDDEEGEQARTDRTRAQDVVMFAGLQRLGLRGVRSVPQNLLDPFVLSFPSLTHLDLSCTKATPDLLAALSTSTTVRLRALSLERCAYLTGESIRDFLVHAPAARPITELNLYGDAKHPCPLSAEDLAVVLGSAPCFTSGELTYLDLSSAPLTPDMLARTLCAQPRLRSLGVSHIPTLPLRAVRDFLVSKAPHVEVLALAGTGPELGYTGVRTTMQQAMMVIHAHLVGPLCTVPCMFSLTPVCSAPKAQPPTRLRVIEFSTQLLGGLQAGAGSWRVVRSKGGRGWYVDTASGWVTEAGLGAESGFQRELPSAHPLRLEMEKLAAANGNVSSGVGWHARKMEVLHGHGMLGREDGLYGAVSFAYQG